MLGKKASVKEILSELKHHQVGLDIATPPTSQVPPTEPFKVPFDSLIYTDVIINCH